MNNDYQRSIDGLRGLAILLVIMFHRNIAYFGWTGVILFFVLSGYLITKVLITEKDKESSLRIKFKNFWARRSLRIFPLYYLYLFILIIILLGKWISPQMFFEMPSLASYTYNFYLIYAHNSKGPSFLAGHFWSLSIEEQFYLFYPFLVFYCKRRQLKIVVIGSIVFSVLFRLFFSEFPGISYHPFSYLDSFFCGAAIFIFRLDKLRPSIQYIIFIISLIITVGGGLFIYMDITKGEIFNVRKYLSSFGIVAHYGRDFHRVWGLLQLNLLFSSLLLLLIAPIKNKIHLWLKRIFELQPLVAIGKVSYGMYVFHAIVIWLLLDIFNYDNIAMNKYLFFIICLAVTWFVSFAVYYLFEKRFLMLKERFR